MITDYSCNNFKSFRNEVEFTLVPESKINILPENIKDDCLKGLLFVGPNAAGKTNSISVLELLVELISKERFNIDKYINIFTKENINLSYKFRINEKEVFYYLHYEPKTKRLMERISIDEKDIISRDNEKYTSDGIDLGDIGQKTIFKKIFDWAKENNQAELNELYRFIDNSVVLDLFASGISTTSYKHYNPTIEYTDEVVDFINGFLKMYNFEFKIVKEEPGMVHHEGIYFLHKGTDVNVPYEIESVGNRNLIYILPIFKKVLEEDSMLILDEFGRAMHNKLEQLLIRYFMTNSNGAQIFIISHSTNLLSNALLRPDQIYTIDFLNHMSIAEKFSKENPRNSQNLEKMYLGGVFGGLPDYTKQ